MSGVCMVHGVERVEHSAVAAVDARPQRFGYRGHAQVPATVASDESDESDRPQDPEQPDTRRCRRHDCERQHKNSGQDFDSQHVPSPLFSLVLR
jgi:hypothetical protein